MIRQRLADAEMTVEGLKADLIRVESALGDYMLSGKQGHGS